MILFSFILIYKILHFIKATIQEPVSVFYFFPALGHKHCLWAQWQNKLYPCNDLIFC